MLQCGFSSTCFAQAATPMALALDGTLGQRSQRSANEGLLAVELKKLSKHRPIDTLVERLAPFLFRNAVFYIFSIPFHFHCAQDAADGRSESNMH